MVECAGQHCEMLDIPETRPSCVALHTNHYLGCGELSRVKTGTQSSYHRFSRASDVLKNWDQTVPGA